MTCKTKFYLTISILIAVIVAAVIMFVKSDKPSTNTVEEVGIEFATGIDEFGNNYTVNYYEEDGFVILRVYMGEDKESSWNWMDYENKIICNYIRYQDDHYVISFKPDDSFESSRSVVSLLPLTHNHGIGSETSLYNSYVIEVDKLEEGGYGFNIYPAKVQDDYTTELSTESALPE